MPAIGGRKVLLGGSSLFHVTSMSGAFITAAVLRLMRRNILGLSSSIRGFLGFPLQGPSCESGPVAMEVLLARASDVGSSRH